jgi:hypothetical protein
LDLRRKVINFILCAALTAFMFFGITFHPVVVQNVSGGYFDFVSFYTAGKMVKEGLRRQLYNYDAQQRLQRDLTGRTTPLPYNHPAFESLLFVPLAFLPYLWAYRLWTLVNLLLMGFSAYLLRAHLANIHRLSLRLILVLSLFIPMFVTLLQGQDSILMLFLYTLVFLSLREKRESRAGCFLALALLKFQLVLPFVPVFFVKRSWKLVRAFLGLSLLLGLASLGLTGWGGVRDWLNLVRHQNDRLPYGPEGAVRTISPLAMPNLRGFLYALLSGSARPVVLDLLVALCSVLLVVWAVTRWKGQSTYEGRAFDLLFALNLEVALLVAYHLNLHDLVLIGLPVLLVFNHIETVEAPGSVRRLGLVAATALLFLLLALLLKAGSQHFHLLFWVLLALAVLTSAEITDTRRRGCA